MAERNARQAVSAIEDFIRAQRLEQASVNHIAADFKAKNRGTVPFILADVSAARRRIQSQPLTQSLKEILVETRKPVALAQKPLPVEIRASLIAPPAPRPPVAIVPPPPPVQKPALEPRLLLAPSGNVAACTTGNLSESIDELSQQERCDPTAIVVYRPQKVRVQRLIEVVEEL